MKKFDRGAVASGARTSSGVRLLAASVIPVSAFVTPGPWCTESTPSRPDTRAYASAIVAAPASCTAGTNRAPAATSALVTWKLPLPIRPNTCRTPACASVRPTTSATLTTASRPRT